MVFDAALDGAAWPGPLAGRDAAFGEAWCGPLGLLARLETELGLLADHPTATERAASLSQQLAGRDGYWSRSFEADPLATAKRLLSDRDLLALWGWTGQAADARLDALWTATAGAAPGIPDRLLRVLELLPRRAVDLASLTMFEAVDTLPPLWRRVLESLVAGGVTLAHRPLSAVKASGDLAAARRSPFRPRGDGSLALVRPHGPLAAAEEIAAALAACESLDGVVIVGADAVLDAALVRHGLPRLGEPRGDTASAALVRLVLETAFKPMDPDDLHALICADPGPVHGRLKRRLVRALAKFPARGSTEWTQALADGLENIDDEQRDAVAARFAALVHPVVGRDEALSIDRLADRMRALATWAHGRAIAEPSLRATAVLADRVVAFARMTGAAQLDRTALHRLLDEVVAPQVAGGDAEVGLATVSTPGAVVGAARAIVWWDFVRGSAPAAARLRLSGAEHAALRDAGVTPPDLGGVMAGEARRWQRPLEMASEALVLVCPRTDAAGERAHPHPLWDELIARVPRDGDAAALEREQVVVPAAARRKRVKLRALVAPTAEVRVRAGLELGDPESPSSLETLLGCSLAWALERKGLLWGGLGPGPGAPSPLHYGNIAHLVLEQVFGEPVASPEVAAARAAEVFDANVGVLAEALTLPDFQARRAELRVGIVESVRRVARLVDQTGARVRGLELEVTGKLGTAKVAGRTDLMLTGPDAIIDFKWGFSTYRELLTTGTAFQLVAYAALEKAGRKLPEVAYLTLQRQQLLAPAGTSLPDARTFSAHTAKDMLEGAVAAIEERRSELARGQLRAPSAIEDVDAFALDGGVMRLAPKCRYCDLGAICGRRTRP